MMTKWLVLLVALALCGCSSSPQGQISRGQVSQGQVSQGRVSQPPRLAWDGLGRDPNLPAMKWGRTKTGEANLTSEAELAKLHPYSPEWVSLRGQIDAEEQARISKLMVICRGCNLASVEADRINLTPLPTPNRRTTEAVR